MRQAFKRYDFRAVDQPFLLRCVEQRMAHYLGGNFTKDSFAYKILNDYPTRPGKGIRPLLCLVTCGAVGGDINNALTTAAALEFMHNGFLIKDDIVDGSDYRRGKRTLNKIYGEELAINAGDALKTLALSALLDNLQIVGVRKTLQVMLEFLRMSTISVQGQMKELTWVKTNRVNLKQADYNQMCIEKTCWYTCVAPCRTGVIIGSEYATDQQLDVMTRFGSKLGVGFQIRDDVLNIASSFGRYGKEIQGDILEGKRTAILIHAIGSSTRRERARARAILAKKREEKNADDVAFIGGLIEKHGSLEYSMTVSRRFAREAKAILDGCEWMTENAWKSYLYQLCDYLIQRDK